MPRTTLFLIPLILFSKLVSSDTLDVTMRSKLIESKPKITQSQTDQVIEGSIVSWPFIFKTEFPENDLTKWATKSEEITFTFLGHLYEIPFYPWNNLNQLQFASKYEFYQVSKNIVPGENSSTGVKAYVGEKSGGYIKAKSAYGASAGKTIMKFNDERYQSCKYVLGIKKCEWKTRKVARGYTTDEEQDIIDSLLAHGHQALIDKLPSRVMLGKKVNESILKLKERAIFRGVKVENLVRVLNGFGIIVDGVFDLEQFLEVKDLFRVFEVEGRDGVRVVKVSKVGREFDVVVDLL